MSAVASNKPVTVPPNLAAVKRELPADHPLRSIKPMAEEALAKLVAVFAALLWAVRPVPIPATRVLKATLLMALYGMDDSVAFCEQVADNVGLRWFLSMRDGEENLDPAAFEEGQARFARNHAVREFFANVLGQAARAGLLSDRHFCLDQARIEAWGG